MKGIARTKLGLLLIAAAFAQSSHAQSGPTHPPAVTEPQLGVHAR